MRIAGYLLLFFICLHVCFCSDAQPGTTIDLKKPEKYENRTLASEKTTDAKIKISKNFTRIPSRIIIIFLMPI